MQFTQDLPHCYHLQSAPSSTILTILPVIQTPGPNSITSVPFPIFLSFLPILSGVPALKAQLPPPGEALFPCDTLILLLSVPALNYSPNLSEQCEELQVLPQYQPYPFRSQLCLLSFGPLTVPAQAAQFSSLV